MDMWCIRKLTMGGMAVQAEAHPFALLADMWNQPSSSGSGGGFTLAQELLGLPAISQGFTAKVRTILLIRGSLGSRRSS